MKEHLRDIINECAQSHIRKMLLKHGDNKPKTAKALGISVSSLYRKIKELKIY